MTNRRFHSQQWHKLRPRPNTAAASGAGSWVKLKPPRKAAAAEAPAAEWVKLKPPPRHTAPAMGQAEAPPARGHITLVQDLDTFLAEDRPLDATQGITAWADRFLPEWGQPPNTDRLTLNAPPLSWGAIPSLPPEARLMLEIMSAYMTQADPQAAMPRRPPIDAPGTRYKFTGGLLQWYGSKFSLAEWVASHFPAHSVYVEAFSGPATVGLIKPVSELEIFSDLDGRLTNFLIQVRDNPEALAALIILTPYSEVLWQQAAERHPDPLTDAANFWLYCAGSIRGGPVSASNGFRWNAKPEDRYRTYADPAYRDGYAKTLQLAARRLSGAFILNRNAFDLIPRFESNPDCLIYCDPPYMLSERVNRTAYGEGELADNETADLKTHSELARLLNYHKGYVVISGYANPFYDRLYAEWTRYDRESQTNSGGSRTESVWVNPKAAAALTSKGVQLKLL